MTDHESTRMDAMLKASALAQRSDRPEWVHCVKQSHEERKGQTWCGRPPELAFMFLSLDHAANTIAAGSRLEPCPDCIRVAFDLEPADYDRDPGPDA